MTTSPAKPSASLVALMLGLVYISWGSVYIGNKLSLEIAGPFFVCGMRNGLAGLLTLIVSFFVQKRLCRPMLMELIQHALLAILLVTLASGFLALGQTQATSGVAAIVMSSTPIFMLVAAFLFAGEPAPSRPQIIGMTTGACAVVYLAWTQQAAGTSTVLGILIMFGAIAGWVAGSMIMKKMPVSGKFSSMESTGLILLLGGIESLVVGVWLGELDSIRPEALRAETILGFGWMVVGGSFIAYASYLWLLARVSVSLCVSYEYVVPVIGLFLGWLIGGEQVTPDMICACAVSIASVFLVVRHRHSMRSYIRHYIIRHHMARQRTAPRRDSGTGNQGRF